MGRDRRVVRLLVVPTPADLHEVAARVGEIDRLSKWTMLRVRHRALEPETQLGGMLYDFVEPFTPHREGDAGAIFATERIWHGNVVLVCEENEQVARDRVARMGGTSTNAHVVCRGGHRVAVHAAENLEIEIFAGQDVGNTTTGVIESFDA